MIYGWKGICSDNWMLLGVKSKKSRHNGLFTFNWHRQPATLCDIFFFHLLIYHLMSCSKQAISKEEAMLYFFLYFLCRCKLQTVAKNCLEMSGKAPVVTDFWVYLRKVIHPHQTSFSKYSPLPHKGKYLGIQFISQRNK